MLIQGLIVMLIGMATVFLFLGIMVILMNSTAFFMKFFPEEKHSVSPKTEQKPGLEEIAIAVAAIKKSMKN